jgi:mevalonate kinase
MTDLKIDKEVIGSIAIRVEQKKHGNPSYGDVAAVINGGLIWFRKETPDVIVVQPLIFSVPKKLSQNLMVIQSGVPEESTGEMVHNVALFKQQNPQVVDKILEDQERLTRDLLGAIKNADEESIINIIREGEKNLEKIGVVSESAKELIREIEKTGGAAKICGAGGREKGSGIILVYHVKKKEAESIAKAQGLDYYTIQLGGKGLEIK